MTEQFVGEWAYDSFSRKVTPLESATEAKSYKRLASRSVLVKHSEILEPEKSRGFEKYPDPPAVMRRF